LLVPQHNQSETLKHAVCLTAFMTGMYMNTWLYKSI